MPLLLQKMPVSNMFGGKIYKPDKHQEPVHDLSREAVSGVKSSAGTGVYADK
ncbi:hypothetical protein [Formivibrio citricus]|uniref:hypothetical protein n=1 Tax=Formivibrio citricus TaxID=83765 RepID=UPI0015A68F77|nr:hypothetical protein [Formivibrio citricus]